MNFNVIAISNKAGMSKANRPYAMTIVQGVFTNDDGEMNVCEFTFFAENGRQTPNLVVGQTYVPVIKVGVSRDKKLAAYVDDLVLEKTAEIRKAA